MTVEPLAEQSPTIPEFAAHTLTSSIFLSSFIWQQHRNYENDEKDVHGDTALFFEVVYTLLWIDNKLKKAAPF